MNKVIPKDYENLAHRTLVQLDRAQGGQSLSYLVSVTRSSTNKLTAVLNSLEEAGYVFSKGEFYSLTQKGWDFQSWESENKKLEIVLKKELQEKEEKVRRDLLELKILELNLEDLKKVKDYRSTAKFITIASLITAIFSAIAAVVSAVAH